NNPRMTSTPSLIYSNSLHYWRNAAIVTRILRTSCTRIGCAYYSARGRSKLIMLIVGLMSGTSVDGIDAALCEISGTLGNTPSDTPSDLQARIIGAITFPYPEGFQARVIAASQPETGRVA